MYGCKYHFHNFVKFFIMMSNNYFIFKQFTVNQEKSAFKVGTDGVLLGASAEVEGKTNILDVGTGTGLIALMLAQRSTALITAIEPDMDSFLQASENIRQSKWADKIYIENCTLQDFDSKVKDYDLIVTNPPYFIDSLKNPDPSKSASRHNDNLTHYDILEGADRMLSDDGDLQLILPYEEGQLFLSVAVEMGFFPNDILNIRPGPGYEIKRLILRLSRKEKHFSERFLTIEKGKRHDFTEEYIALTKDFYLKF